MVLTKEQILKAKDTETKKVSVPEWGGEVFVRTLSGTERDGFEQDIIEHKGDSRKVNYKNMRAKFCALTICDEKSNRIFTEADVNALGAKSAKALDRIFTVAQKLNGLGPDDIEELAKNSEGGLSANSTSN